MAKTEINLNNNLNETEEKNFGEKPKFSFRKLLLPALMVILAALLVVAMVVFREEEGPQMQSKSIYGYFDTVGTVYSFVGDSSGEFKRNCLLVEETLDYYHRLFDIYNDHDGVGIYEINKNAGVRAVAVSVELIDFLEFCKEAYTLTDGEVNIAMGAVLSLWHDCRTEGLKNPENARLPDEAALAEAARHCDINNLIIDRENMTVYLSDPEMSLDVGAVGKGYAVERAAQRLLSEGVTGYALDVGGNIRIIGEKPSGEPFRTGIKNPLSEDGDYVEILEIKNTSAVTSGGYQRGYYVDGVRYHHIIDKDTLTSAEHFASVTVVTEDSGLADALSTALFCMEFNSGKALVDSLDGVFAVWVYKDGSVAKSE